MKKVICVLLLCVGIAIAPQRTFKEMSVYRVEGNEAILESKSGHLYVIKADGLRDGMRLLCYCDGEEGKGLRVLDYYEYR